MFAGVSPCFGIPISPSTVSALSAVTSLPFSVHLLICVPTWFGLRECLVCFYCMEQINCFNCSDSVVRVLSLTHSLVCFIHIRCVIFSIQDRGTIISPRHAKYINPRTKTQAITIVRISDQLLEIPIVAPELGTSPSLSRTPHHPITITTSAGIHISASAEFQITRQKSRSRPHILVAHSRNTLAFLFFCPYFD